MLNSKKQLPESSEPGSSARLSQATTVLSQLMIPTLTWLAMAATYFATASNDHRLMGWAVTLLSLYATVVAVIWWQTDKQW